MRDPWEDDMFRAHQDGMSFTKGSRFYHNFDISSWSALILGHAQLIDLKGKRIPKKESVLNLQLFLIELLDQSNVNVY